MIGTRCRSAEFSPDGRRVVTKSENRVSIWDAVTGELITILGSEIHEDFRGTIRVYRGGCKVVTFSADGRNILVNFNNDIASRVWHAPFPSKQGLVEELKKAVPRCLTREQREKAFLDIDPPYWCIEMEKWPYQTQDWKDWLRFKRANADPPLPDTPEWQPWVAAHH